MAAGLVVIGTTTGGTREILQDGETGFTFAPNDVESLAARVVQLSLNPALGRRLAHAGRQTVLEKFTLDRMVNEIEGYLLECFAGKSTSSLTALGR
jgi:glycosyltransferase involved in cell wall biosynthesis